MPSKFNPTAEQYRKASLTGYNSLIPMPTSIDFDRNLKAEVHDPLWFLARQWQMGEFQGEDAGSPAFVRVESSLTQPQTLRLDTNTPPESYDARQVPLEVLVERESVAETVHLRVQAGYYFIKLLKNINLGQHTSLFIEKYALPQDNQSDWDIDRSELLRGTRNVVPDGLRIISDLNNQNQLQNWIQSKPVLTPSVSAILTAAKDLSAWLKRQYPLIASNNETARPKAWKTDQLEYRLELETRDAATNQVTQLTSDNYADGQLDWQDFIWKGANILPNAIKKVDNFIPSPVRYQGMPQPRYWEMEEGRVNFGKISMAPSNILSMAFAEFGLTYSNDWFWVPISLKINTLCQIDNLVVVNVFGDKTNYPLLEQPATDPLSMFSLFQLYNPENNINRSVLYMPPTVTKIQESEPLERVYFIRDEISNLSWAIETIAPSATQRGKDQKLVQPTSNEPTAQTGLVYTLGNIVPENWTPFVPVRLNGTQQTRLQRAKMPNSQPPKGQILQDIELYKKPYLIREEEIGKEGTVIERSWQRTRWLNGKTFTWIGRRKTVGRIETSNTLRWDIVR